MSNKKKTRKSAPTIQAHDDVSVKITKKMAKKARREGWSGGQLMSYAIQKAIPGATGIETYVPGNPNAADPTLRNGYVATVDGSEPYISPELLSEAYAMDENGPAGPCSDDKATLIVCPACYAEMPPATQEDLTFNEVPGVYLGQTCVGHSMLAQQLGIIPVELTHESYPADAFHAEGYDTVHCPHIELATSEAVAA